MAHEPRLKRGVPLSMKILLASTGTAGNVLPFVGLGKCLRERGHQVILAAGGNCRSMAERENIEFFNIDPPPGALSFDLAHRDAGGKEMGKQLLEEGIYQIEHVYRWIKEQYVPGHTVVACPGWLFGGRIAQEHLGIPLASVCLQPMMIRTTDGKPLPRFVSRFFDRLIDVVVDQALAKPLNKFRATLGLPNVSRVMNRWWFSPQRILGLYPDWFSPVPSEWKEEIVLTGFPYFDTMTDRSNLGEVQAFLDAGSAPLVFSQASLVKDAKGYFSTCAEIAKAMNRRAILLTAHPEHLPRPLPNDVVSFGFVPLSDVLPQAAAFIHHGGVGSIAQALAAGVPQLTVPGFIDQPDNSKRLLKLGVSANLMPKDFSKEKAVPLLSKLISSTSVRENCRKYARLSEDRESFTRAAIELEKLEGTDGQNNPPS